MRVDEGGGKRGWLLLRQSLHDPLLVLNVETEVAGGCAKTALRFKCWLARLRPPPTIPPVLRYDHLQRCAALVPQPGSPCRRTVARSGAGSRPSLAAPAARARRIS